MRQSGRCFTQVLMSSGLVAAAAGFFFVLYHAALVGRLDSVPEFETCREWITFNRLWLVGLPLLVAGPALALIRSELGRCPARFLVYLGLVAAAVGIFFVLYHVHLTGQYESVPAFKPIRNWVWFNGFWLFGLLLLAVGLGAALLLSPFGWSDPTVWPELALGSMLALVCLVVVALAGKPLVLRQDEYIDVPIPASKVEGSTDLFSSGQVLDLSVFVPNPRATPERWFSTLGEVRTVRGEDESAVILIAIPTEAAEPLQEALLAADSKLTYRLLPGMPARTPAPVGPLSTAPVPGSIDVPVPAGLVEGNTDLLSPGQMVDLAAYAPDPSKTPKVQVSTFGEVRTVRGDKENLVIVVAVPTEAAEGLQRALLADGAKLVYRLQATSPTPTAPPTPTTAATAPPSPIPSSTRNRTYVWIKADEIEPPASTLSLGGARLVVIRKIEKRADKETGTVTTTYEDGWFCVTVKAFRDDKGRQQAGYSTNESDKTAYVQIELDTSQLPHLAQSLAAKEQIWMVNEKSCPTPTPTPAG